MRREIGLSADRRQMDPLAVDRELHLVRILQAAHDVQVGPIELHLEGVLAVERKRVANQDAADGAERQAVDVLILRQVLPDAVGVAAGRDARDRRPPGR